jgi:AcrR family transcriptional regulator
MATYHHGDLRTAVLAAAWKVLEEEGLPGLSVREAARRAGVSHNAPYRHFANREALLAALVAQGFEQLDRALENLAGRELGEAYVAFALEHPQRFRLMFSRARANAELQSRFVDSFAHLGADAAAAGAAAWSLVHGLASLVLEGQLEGGHAFIRRVLGAMRFAAAPQRSA